MPSRMSMEEQMRNLENMRAIEEARGALLARILSQEPKAQKTRPEDVLRDARENTSRNMSMTNGLVLGRSEFSLGSRRSMNRIQYGVRNPDNDDGEEESDAESDNWSGNTFSASTIMNTKSTSLHQQEAFQDLDCPRPPAVHVPAHTTLTSMRRRSVTLDYLGASPAGDDGATAYSNGNHDADAPSTCAQRSVSFTRGTLAATNSGRFDMARLLHLVNNNAGPSAITAAANMVTPAGGEGSDDDESNPVHRSEGVLTSAPPSKPSSYRRRSIDVTPSFWSASATTNLSPTAASCASPSTASPLVGSSGRALRPTTASRTSSGLGYTSPSGAGSNSSSRRVLLAAAEGTPAPAPANGGGALTSRPRAMTRAVSCAAPAGSAVVEVSAASETCAGGRGLTRNHVSLRRSALEPDVRGSAAAAASMVERSAQSSVSAFSGAAPLQPRPPVQPRQGGRSFRRGSLDETWLTAQRVGPWASGGAAAAEQEEGVRHVAPVVAWEMSSRGGTRGGVGAWAGSVVGAHGDSTGQVGEASEAGTVMSRLFKVLHNLRRPDAE